MKETAYWEPRPYLCREPKRLPPGQTCADLVFYRCTNCLNTANGFRTPFCPWCGCEMREIYEKEMSKDD